TRCHGDGADARWQRATERAARVVARAQAASQGQGPARQTARRPVCGVDHRAALSVVSAREGRLQCLRAGLSRLQPPLRTGGLKTMADIYVLTTETVVLEDHVSFTLTS